MKPLHKYRNGSLISVTLCQTQNAEVRMIQEVILPSTFSTSFCRNTALVPSPCCSDLSFPNFGRTQLTWSFPTLLLPTGIWRAALKTKETGHFPLCTTQKSHQSNKSSLLWNRDYHCNHKTSSCYLNSIETTDMCSWKHDVFSICPNVSQSLLYSLFLPYVKNKSKFIHCCEIFRQIFKHRVAF